MFEPPPDHETVLETRNRHHCNESRLVLNAVGIAAQAIHDRGRWYLIVQANDYHRAATELADYDQEISEPAPVPVVVPTYGGAVNGVFVYAFIILLVGLITADWAFAWDWMPVGRMRAELVTAGQWWRTVTALTLHVDAEHLLGNLVFGSVFGLLAGRVLGGGVAWLVIVLAGALGNLVNAFVQAPTHTSIGASTAVFAALGVLVSHALRPRESPSDSLLKRWSPLIAGTVLLGMTGVGGERTDVLAHFTGFLAGMLTGWIGCRLPNRWLDNRNVQLWTGLFAVTIVVASWAIAMGARRMMLPPTPVRAATCSAM